MAGILPHPPDDPDSHIDLWANTAFTLQYTGNHLILEGDIAWWELMTGEDDCANATVPTTAQSKGGPLNGNLEHTVTLLDGDYVLCMQQLSPTESVEHGHVTAYVHSSPPSTPPPPPSPPPSIQIWAAWGGTSNNNVFEDGACVTDPLATSAVRISNGETVDIAAQCCETDSDGSDYNVDCYRHEGGDDSCFSGTYTTSSFAAKTYGQALSLCAATGLELCDRSCYGQGCAYNYVLVWTKLPCPAQYVPPSPPLPPSPPAPPPMYWTHFAHIGTTDALIGSSSYNSAVGSQAAGDSVWWLSCATAEYAAASAGVSIKMKLTMGDVVDYFRPTGDNSLCDMLASNTKHQFSPDGETWYTPDYWHSASMGGSASGWPRNNVPGDQRAFLSFWGSTGSAVSGCCHNSLTDYQAWNKPFDLYINTAPNPPSSPNPPSPPPSSPPPFSMPPTGVWAVMGNSNHTDDPYSNGRCVTDASATQVYVGSTQRYLAAQCCVVGDSSLSGCRRYDPTLGNTDAGCYSGKGDGFTAKTILQTEAICKAAGLELCSGSCKAQGCDYGNRAVWTGLPCPELASCFGAEYSVDDGVGGCLTTSCTTSGTVFWGTLAEAMTLCQTCSNSHNTCSVIHDWGDDGVNWRACQTVNSGTGAVARTYTC